GIPVEERELRDPGPGMLRRIDQLEPGREVSPSLVERRLETNRHRAARREVRGVADLDTMEADVAGDQHEQVANLHPCALDKAVADPALQGAGEAAGKALLGALHPHRAECATPLRHLLQLVQLLAGQARTSRNPQSTNSLRG